MLFRSIWQHYAALIAAAYARCVIELIPGPGPELSPKQENYAIRVFRKGLSLVNKTLVRPDPEDFSSATLTSAQVTPSAASSAALREAAGVPDTLLGPRTQSMLIRTADLPSLIRRAIRVWDVGQATSLGDELERLLASVGVAHVPLDKRRECYLALYDLEAAKVAGQTPPPAQSIRRMKDFLEEAKNVPGS